MTTQSFKPTNNPIKSLNIPTPNLEQVKNSFIVRLLIVERVRCIMDELTFADHPKELIEKYLTVPPAYETVEQKAAFIQSESLEIMTAFNHYEQTPIYKEALSALVPYKGHVWRLVSSTFSGILITIEV